MNILGHTKKNFVISKFNFNLSFSLLLSAIVQLLNNNLLRDDYLIIELFKSLAISR